MRYRLRMNGSYQYVWEKGKRIFEDPNSNVILGYAKKMSTDFFEHTGIKEIDEVKHMEDLKNDMMGLFINHHLFSLVSINLTNLPDINKAYGRQVGNIMIGEYLKRLKINFQTESSGIYRSSGLLFYFTITDGRKMELFKRGLISNGNAMNLAMIIGGIKVELQVNMGIAEAITDAVDPDNLIKCSNEAIKASMVPNSQSKFVYYKDIKDLNI